jgi:hypothetical protein
MMLRSIIFFCVLLIIFSCGSILAGGVGPPPSPMAVPLDGGASAILLASGAYIGYRALKKKEDDR